MSAMTTALLAVIGAMLAASHATADTVKSPQCDKSKPARKTLRTVRDVDWCNADVGSAWKGGTLRDGHSEVHLYADLGKPHDTISTTLRGIAYGDLDGDKRLEAALVIETTTWIAATGNHSGGTRVTIFSLDGGKPTRLGSIASGTPVQAITLRKGVVSVTSGSGRARTTQRYRRESDGFVEVATKTDSP